MKRLKSVILAMATLVIVSGCKNSQTKQRSEAAAGQGASLGAARVTELRNSYNECRGKAQDDVSRLLLCSDRAVDAMLALDPAARATLAEDFTSLGDALANSTDNRSAEAARVLAADQVVRYGLTRLSLPECAVSSSAAACAAARSALRQSVIREATRTFPAKVTTSGSTAPFGGYSPPTCAQVRSSVSVDVALGQFDREFPMALKDEKLVEARQLDQDQLRPIVGYLACLAARTDFGPEVAETSLWLFSSKRNGAQARAALSDLAWQGGVDAKAAVEYGRQIDGYLASDKHEAN